MASAHELRRRWFEPGAPALGRAVGRWLTGQGERPDGLAEVAGRTDLRGLPLAVLPTTVGTGEGDGARVVWESLDLRGADVAELRFFGARLADCLFDRANCTGWRVWGTTVEDCSFVRADLRSRGLGGGGPWQGRTTEWRRVDFSRARLAESAFTGCALHQCTFQDPGPRLVIEDCAVTEIVVRGEVRSLIVTGVREEAHPTSASRPFTGDLSAAVLRDSHVIGYALHDVAVPRQDDVRLIQDLPTVLPGLLAALRTQNPDGARTASVWEGWLRHPGRPGTDLLLDLGQDPAVVAAVDAALHSRR